MAVELDKYGFKTIDLAFATESANINALLKDLEKPDVVKAINKLPGFKVLVKNLKATQTEFEVAFLKLMDMQIEKSKLLSATKLSKLLRNQINNELLVYLRGISLAKPKVYKECLEVVEEIIEMNNSKVRNRLRKSDEESHA